jgi:hypothetical protein
MFSTIDSEHSRFVHAYVMTKDGPLPLQIPRATARELARLASLGPPAEPSPVDAGHSAGRSFP